MCLIEAALAADRIVASNDDTVRHLFSSASQKVAALRQVMWVNPTTEEEKPIEWLEGGAPDEAERHLGFSCGDDDNDHS